MNDQTRRCLLLVTVAWLVCSFGCGPSSPTKPTPPKQYGEYSKAEIEAKMKDMLKLKEITLKEEAKGKYTGTATGLDGTKYTKISVTAEQDTLKWKCETEDEK